MSRPVPSTASGNIGPANGGSVGSLGLTAGSDTATAVWIATRADGSTQRIAKMSATAGTTVDIHMADPAGAKYEGQLAVTLTGTSPEAFTELM